MSDDGSKRTSTNKIKTNKKRDNKKEGRKWVMTIVPVTFVISAALQTIQSGLMNKVNLIMAFLILSIFIAIGIVFDIIGVAVTSATETPFHSLSSQKKRGAKEAVRLVRNADKVGSFCNDVIGDIVGIISGSAATAIVVMLFEAGWFNNEFILKIVLTAFVAALTIGGKALGKRVAIDKSNEIVFAVGKIVSFIAPVHEKHIGRTKIDGSKTVKENND